MKSAHTLAHLVTESDLAQGSLYPALPRIREVSAHIAAATAGAAYESGIAGRLAVSDALSSIEAQMYNPHQ